MEGMHHLAQHQCFHLLQPLEPGIHHNPTSQPAKPQQQ